MAALPAPKDAELGAVLGSKPRDERRIYNELGLQLRNRSPKRQVKAKLREDRCEATWANETWAVDFVHDQLATGKKLRVLAVVDTFSRLSPAVDARFSCRGEDVVATLERVCAEVGFPKSIRVDQGSELVSRDLELRDYRHGVSLDFSRPGKPTDNAFMFRRGVRPTGALADRASRSTVASGPSA